MKLRSLKIGQVIITPNILLSIIGAFLVLGMGIGVTIASPNNSKSALFFSTIISLLIIARLFIKKTEKLN